MPFRPQNTFWMLKNNQNNLACLFNTLRTISNTIKSRNLHFKNLLKKTLTDNF